LTFTILVTDDESAIEQVVVLYRELASNEWKRVNLAHDRATDTASASVAASGEVEYFVQAVDATGNVALALDHGNPFRVTVPLIIR
jgi:hypothetical protein